MKKGQFTELVSTSSARYARQWMYQGTAKVPYTVSLRTDGHWECGCPAWTRPKDGVREDCKHILHVQRDGLKQFSVTSINNVSPAPVKFAPAVNGRKIR